MIYLGADHGGYELKEQARQWLDDWGYEYQDLGAFELDPNDDYPDYAIPVAESVAQDETEQSIGVLLCRSAGGVTIAANKVAGARAVAVRSEDEARHAREHNNANIIALSGDWLSPDEAQQVLQNFLETEFTGAERHQRRLTDIAKYEEGEAPGLLYPGILVGTAAQAQQELDEIREIPGVEVFQIDVIDGIFADNATITPSDLQEINFHKERIDLHLMVEEPLDYVYECDSLSVELPIRAVIAQVERMSFQEPFLDEIIKHDWLPGLSLDLYTPVEAIDEASWEKLKVVQLMGIEAGFQGQEFHSGVLYKIEEVVAEIENRGLEELEIIIDGGVKFGNLQPLLNAGADAVVVGSGLWKTQNAREAAVKYLVGLEVE